MNAEPVVSFYRLIEQTTLPQRADRFGAGLLPIRAARYCDSITSATGFGWWLFPPMNFSLLWDGHQVFWQYEGAEDWLSLTTAQFPNQLSRFNEGAPEALRGCSPPFLTVLPEPGLVQIWTGLLARTAPEWSLLIRPLANMPTRSDIEFFEGIVETDRWFGPLFTNVRLSITHTAINFSDDSPLVQVQPIPRTSYDDETLNTARLISDISKFTAQDWADYDRHIVSPNDDVNRPPGSYAKAVRKRRRCSVA